METITIKDIARICGVGVSTVSRALNNHPDINQETKQRIMEVVDQYDFVPNNSARSLKITASNTIAVLVKGRSNPFFAKMIDIMIEDIQNHNYSMELRNISEESDEVEVAIELVKEKKLQGIVFLGGLTTHPADKLRKIGVPFVLSTISMTGEGEGECSSISVDDILESTRITEYLINKGHKKIAIMGASANDTSISQLRIEGYLKALNNHKIEPNSSLVWHSKENVDNMYSIENGYNMMKEALERGDDFTAVFAIADTMAFGAIRALSEAGKKVPEDVSVVGFDGIDMGKYSIPAITTISQPFEEMALKTTQLLFDVMGNGGKPKKITMDATLLERESVRAI